METVRITKDDIVEKDGRRECVKEIAIDVSLHIDSGLGWVWFPKISVKGSIVAEAGSGIEAGLGIEAGEGIEAGLAIVAKWISSGLRIFAGTCNWRLPEITELQIRTDELRDGTVAFGTLVLSNGVSAQHQEIASGELVEPKS